MSVSKSGSPWFGVATFPAENHLAADLAGICLVEVGESHLVAVHRARDRERGDPDRTVFDVAAFPGCLLCESYANRLKRLEEFVLVLLLLEASLEEASNCPTEFLRIPLMTGCPWYWLEIGLVVGARVSVCGWWEVLLLLLLGTLFLLLMLLLL